MEDNVHAVAGYKHWAAAERQRSTAAQQSAKLRGRILRNLVVIPGNDCDTESLSGYCCCCCWWWWWWQTGQDVPC